MRAIDADAMIEFIDMGYLRNPLESCFSERDVVDMLESRPTIDAVPVVRCRECKHHHDCGTHFCDALGMDCPDDSEFFCSYGERREGADHE